MNASDQKLLERLATEADGAVEEGVILGLPAAAQEIAAIAVRRWRSFERRHRARGATFERRVDDLAKGLRQRYPDPLNDEAWMMDLRDLATRLGRVLASEGR